MTELSRRKFMALSASAAAGAAVAGTVGGATAAAGATLRNTGTITDAQHIVILMQENRSFDHYFGMLQGVRGFADRSAIQIAGGYSVFNQPNGSGRQYPWAFSATSPAGGADPERLAQCNGDLSHAWSDQHAAWNNGRMDSWVSAKGNVRTLGHLSRADIPFHYALADNYTVCDAYHCSILSATGPNRTYLWSGWIDPAGTAGGPAYDGGDESGLRWQTYAEALQNAGRELEGLPERVRQLRRQRARLLQPVRSRPGRQPARDQGHGLGPEHRQHARSTSPPRSGPTC